MCASRKQKKTVYKYRCADARKFFNILVNGSRVICISAQWGGVSPPLLGVGRIRAILKGLLTTDSPFSISRQRPTGTVASGTEEKGETYSSLIPTERANERIFRQSARGHSTYRSLRFPPPEWQTSKRSVTQALAVERKWRGSVIRCEVTGAIERAVEGYETEKEEAGCEEKERHALDEGCTARINAAGDREPRSNGWKG